MKPVANNAAGFSIRSKVELIFCDFMVVIISNHDLVNLNLNKLEDDDMFIGREAELKFLNDKYETNGGQLIVLYGRRCVGKMETLREFCKDKPHVFFSCTQTTDRVQLHRNGWIDKAVSLC